MLGQRKPTSSLLSRIQQRGWCLFIWTPRPRTNSGPSETHTHKHTGNREGIRIEDGMERKKKKKKKRSCRAMARRWLCSWLLFAAAGGLFFGFFWALLTRQKIKKLYLCLPLTPPPLYLDSPSHHLGETNTTTHEREPNQSNSSPKKTSSGGNVDALMWTRRVPAMLPSSSSAIGDGRMTAACLSLLSAATPHYTDHTT